MQQRRRLVINAISVGAIYQKTNKKKLFEWKKNSTIINMLSSLKNSSVPFKKYNSMKEFGREQCTHLKFETCREFMNVYWIGSARRRYNDVNFVSNKNPWFFNVPIELLVSAECGCVKRGVRESVSRPVTDRHVVGAGARPTISSGESIIDGNWMPPTIDAFERLQCAHTFPSRAQSLETSIYDHWYNFQSIVINKLSPILLAYYKKKNSHRHFNVISL